MTIETGITYLAIAGKVIDAETQLPLFKARVEIISGPEAFEQTRSAKLQQRSANSNQRLPGIDIEITRHDGSYFFTNLPEGNYQLRCSMQRPTRFVAATRDDVNVTLAENSFPPMTNFELQVQ